MTLQAPTRTGPHAPPPSAGGALPHGAIQLTAMSFQSEDLRTVELEAALAGDPAALGQLVDRLTPIIHVRVARVLLRRRPDLNDQRLRQEVEDLYQEVMVSLFANDAAVLHSWDRSRGLSLDNYVGLIAERQIFTILDSRKKTWPAEFRETSDLDRPSPERSPEQRAALRQTLGRMIEALRRELSAQGFEMFQLLFVEELSVSEVRLRTGMGEDAIYAWRSRLRRKTRSLMTTLDPAPATAGQR